MAPRQCATRDFVVSLKVHPPPAVVGLQRVRTHDGVVVSFVRSAVLFLTLSLCFAILWGGGGMLGFSSFPVDDSFAPPSCRPSRQTREAANTTLLCMLRANRRAFQPLMRSLMGAWWCSQADTAPEVGGWVGAVPSQALGRQPEPRE